MASQVAPSRQEILVACLVESSVTLLHEWHEVLVGYLSPLLQRIAAGGAVPGVRNDLKIGFVSYSDPHIHPNPILARRFFSPPLHLTKELKDDPASLGLGRTASGGRRGMAILEGYVAVLEMFDAVVETRIPLNWPPSNGTQQGPTVSDPFCYLIHIASTPSNKAKKPTWNMNPAMDTVTWDSLPSHLLRRKIRTSMVLTRPIPELQDMYNNLSKTPEPFWLPINKPNHKIFLSGLPPILKDKTVPQKRPATDTPDAPPPPPRPQSQGGSTPAANTTPITAAPPPVPNPANPRPPSVTFDQTPPSIQPPPQSQSSIQPIQARPKLPGQNFDPAKLIAYIRGIDAECRVKLSALSQARDAGKPKDELDLIQSEVNQKYATRLKLVEVYHQLVAKQQQVPGLSDSNSISQNLPQMKNFGQHNGQGQALPAQEQPASHAPQTSAAAAGPEQGIQTSPGRTTANTPFAAFGTNMGKNPFSNIPMSARPGMEAQMQKLLAERTRPPVLAAAPQSQPAPQQNQIPSQGNPVSNAAGANANTNTNTSIMTPRASLGPHIRRWQGILAWPSANSAGRKENQITIALYAQDPNLRCESWPQKLILQPSRVLLNMATIQAWIKECSPVMALISHSPIIGNFEGTAGNMRLFRSLRDSIHSKNLLAHCKLDMPGGPPGTGILVFSTNAQAQNDILVAMIFNNTPLPAAVTAQIPMPTSSANADAPGDSASLQQPMVGGAPSTLQNMSPEQKAFLQQRQAAALAAYNQQQAAQQQQTQQMVSNVSSGNPNTGNAFNVAQFMQSMQARGDNQIGLGGGLNVSQAPGMQPVQHRQSGFNPNLQMLQYLNRRPEDGQGQ